MGIDTAVAAKAEGARSKAKRLAELVGLLQEASGAPSASARSRARSTSLAQRSTTRARAVQGMSRHDRRARDVRLPVFRASVQLCCRRGC